MKARQDRPEQASRRARACDGATSFGIREWPGRMRLIWRRAVQVARAAIGVPDYDTYLAHLHQHHPERTPMSYQAFFLERQNARYKGGGGRCC